MDGELISCRETAAAAFRRPVGKLGHAPPPPRPFGQFGGIVAVNADRSRSGLSSPRSPAGGLSQSSQRKRMWQGASGVRSPAIAIEGNPTQLSRPPTVTCGQSPHSVSNTSSSRCLAYDASDCLTRMPSWMLTARNSLHRRSTITLLSFPWSS